MAHTSRFLKQRQSTKQLLTLNLSRRRLYKRPAGMLYHEKEFIALFQKRLIDFFYQNKIFLFNFFSRMKVVV